jgi:CHAD domain-containing protein
MGRTFTHPELGREVAVDALESAGFELVEQEPLARTAVDTFDGHLHAAGLRLELRRSSASELVLSGPGDDDPDAHVPAVDAPGAAADLPRGPLRDRLVRVTGGERLLPLLTVTSVPTLAVRRDRLGKTTVAVAIHDDLTFDETPAGTPTGPVAELPGWAAEVWPVAGHPDASDRAVHVLASAGLVRSEGDLVALAARCAGVDLATRSSSPNVPVDAHEPAHDGFRRTLLNLARTVDRNRAGTILDLDPEFLHELRVAVRRTRSVLAQGRRVLPDEVRDRYREAFGRLGTQTGPSRDLDVYVIEWDRYVGSLSSRSIAALEEVLVHIERRRQAAHAELAATLRSDAYRELMDGWETWLEQPAAMTGAGEAPLGPMVAKRIAKAQRRLLEHGRAITEESEPERLHDLRKDAKKLRYLIECFGSLFETGPRKTFVRRLKDLQDNLGEHQDAEVHIDQLAELAHDLHEDRSVGVGALLAMGQLTESLERRRAAARAGFGERFAAYDTAKTQRALDDLLDPVREPS